MTTLHKLFDEIVIGEMQNFSLNIFSWPYANIKGQKNKTLSTLNTPKRQSENIIFIFFCLTFKSEYPYINVML